MARTSDYGLPRRPTRRLPGTGGRARSHRYARLLSRTSPGATLLYADEESLPASHSAATNSNGPSSQNRDAKPPNQIHLSVFEKGEDHR